ncbi:MAG: hypothetical protein ACKVQB_03795, partial [Bacteroidia bacterium]
MKPILKKLFFITMLFAPVLGFSQKKPRDKNRGNKGSFYLSWGWNREWYTKSDIHFKGNNYDFTLKSVEAKDRQTPFSLKNYFYPSSVSIPQINIGIGYF